MSDEEKLSGWLESYMIRVDAARDYLVLERIRRCLCSQRWDFEKRLDAIWQKRLNLDGHAETIDAMVTAYMPGDYAEAARFLWDRVPTPTIEGE